MICRQNQSDSGNTFALTIGQNYEIIDETRDFYIVENDNGSEQRYHKRYFEHATGRSRRRGGTRNTRTAPATPVVQRVNIENLNGNNSNGIRVSVINGNNTTTQDLSLALQTTNISCGLQQASGINTVSTRVNQLLDAATFEQRGELRDRIFNRLFSRIASNNRNTGGLLLSTNTNANHFAMLDDALDELAGESIEFPNPNSGNDIMTWVLNLNALR